MEMKKLLPLLLVVCLLLTWLPVTISAVETASGKYENSLHAKYTVEQLVLADDDIYYTPRGNTVYIALDNSTDGGISYWLSGYTLADYVGAYGDACFDTTYWDDLTALMDYDGYVILTPYSLECLINTITGNPGWGDDESCVMYYLFYGNDYPEDITVYGTCGENLSWELKDGVLTISGEGAMYDYSRGGLAGWGDYSFHTLVIAEGVTKIGEYAFDGSYDLVSAAIPDSITSIGARAFQWCSRLTEITIPDGITSIEDSTFYECRNLTSITIPEGVVSVGDSAFLHCSSLTTIAIPDSVTSIGDSAFGGCSSLTKITIPAYVTSLGEHVFERCGNLQINVNEKNDYYSSKEGVLFDKTGKTLLACQHTADGSYEIPDGVTSISCGAFLGCDSLTSVTIPHSVTSIGEEAFLSCGSLTDVLIPDGVTSIGSNAFRYCTNLTSIVIPGTVTYLGIGAFGECGNLQINVNEENEHYSSNNGALFDETGRTLLACQYTTDGRYEIPDSVISIGNHAFSGCKSLISVTIPENVTSIGEEAFAGCDGLTDITIPDGVASIGYGTFLGCDSLSSVTIPDSVTSIGELAFFNCDSLVAVAIPESVTSIGEWAFSDCRMLTTILFCGDAPIFIGESILSYVSATAYYPINNDTWTPEVMQNYGGDITWIASCIDNHTYESVVTAPTYEADGCTTYTCTRCGHSYEGDFVPALVYHQVLEGEESQWSPGSEEPVSVRVDADIENFVEVLLNGQVLDEEYYTLTEGSTIVTLKPEYLATLPAGEYTLELLFTDGSATATFEILAPDVLMGDVNGDGEIDILDANLVVTYYNEIASLTEEQLKAADVNGDGEVDIMDANMIVAYYNEIIDAFPAK